jgi:hypothetical protein
MLSPDKAEPSAEPPAEVMVKRTVPWANAGIQKSWATWISWENIGKYGKTNYILPYFALAQGFLRLIPQMGSPPFGESKGNSFFLSKSK